MGVTVRLAANFDQIMIDAAQPQLAEYADDVLATAKRLARVGTKKRGSRHPGAYRASLKVIRKPNGGFRVLADAPHSTFEEFGRKSARGNRTLGRALASTPLRSE